MANTSRGALQSAPLSGCTAREQAAELTFYRDNCAARGNNTGPAGAATVANLRTRLLPVGDI